MNWPFFRSAPPQSIADGREFMKFLMTRPRIGPGARILCAGLNVQSLLPELVGAGLSLTCLRDEEPSADDADLFDSPEIFPTELHCGAAPREQFGPEPPDFDLLLIQSVSMAEASAGNFLSRTSLIRTGGLLSCLRPGGTVISVPAVPDRNTHAPSCGLRHFQSFESEVALLPLSGTDWSLGPLQAGMCLTVVSLSSRRRSWQEWDRLALNAAAQNQCCCAAATPARAA